MSVVMAGRAGVVLVLAFLFVGIGAHEARAAGAAYQVDTAEVSDPGNCKVESWVSSASNGDRVYAITPTCVVNLGRAVEFSSQFNRSRADEEWGTSATPKLKTNLIPTAIGSWGLALSGQASYDLITKANTGYAVTLPATLRVSETFRINLNAGWQYDRVNALHYTSYGAGIDWRTPDNVWTLTMEAFGQAGPLPEDAARSQTEPRWQVGLRWRPIERFNMDLIYGRNITGENANWITFATTIRFPARD